MGEELSRSWWLIAARGVAGILFGVGAFVWTESTLAALVLLYGSFALVNGIFTIGMGFSMRRQQDLWWLLVLEGIVGILLGVLTFSMPSITVFALVYTIAAWSLITGIFQIATGIRMRKVISNEWLLILGGASSAAFGVLLFAFPQAGALTIVWLLGWYAIVFGILTLFFALRIRGGKNMGQQAPGAA